MPLINSLPENEKRLLMQVAEGGEEAFGMLFHQYRNRLYAFIFSIVRSREMAEDVVQDVFLKIWLRREDLAAVDNFKAYLFRISQNHAINHLRRMSKETLVLLEKQHRRGSGDAAADELLTYKNIQQSLNEIVNSLPLQQKTVYRLSREQNLKQEEIAQQLHISVSTIKNHMTQALRTIRERLGEYYVTAVLAGILLCRIFF